MEVERQPPGVRKLGESETRDLAVASSGPPLLVVPRPRSPAAFGAGEATRPSLARHHHVRSAGPRPAAGGRSEPWAAAQALPGKGSHQVRSRAPPRRTWSLPRAPPPPADSGSPPRRTGRPRRRDPSLCTAAGALAPSRPPRRGPRPGGPGRPALNTVKSRPAAVRARPRAARRPRRSFYHPGRGGRGDAATAAFAAAPRWM